MMFSWSPHRAHVSDKRKVAPYSFETRQVAGNSSSEALSLQHGHANALIEICDGRVSGPRNAAGEMVSSAW
jgi:hypothetical protein